MEEDQGQKHMCKFCSKSFPSGRSLGGHMRSHLINISSDEKLIKKKKLPPLANSKSNSENVYELQENPKKKNELSKSSNDEKDSLFKDRICKECGKGFQSWRALFGHMKCHSVNGRNISSVDEESWNGSNDHLKPYLDSESDNEGLTPCRRKRSDRMIKRYNTSSSLSTIAANLSSCISEIDQQEQEEVAISLIMLSRDVSNWSIMDSVLDQSSENNSNFLESSKISLLKSKKSKSDEENFGFKTPVIPINGLKMSKSHVSACGFLEKKNLDNESEVNSPKKLIEKSRSEKFEIDSNKKNKLSKRKCIGLYDSQLSVPENFQEKVAYFGTSDYLFCEKKPKFECTTCHKAFSSYQALGGHRASQKKFKGCCTPNGEDILNSDQISPNQTANDKLMIDIFAMKAESEIRFKNNSKDHECPICFKVFASGQALGGHKRSHLIREAKSNPSIVIEKQEPIRDFLDLNLPAPVEEDLDNDRLRLKPWWRGTSSLEHELLLSLLSS
ncbi:zinc finger ZAT4-like [Olea europaea subsp. europaea]|uniref:Zinc finger ZAT4-like n=1 Tax=Olea europaea subsp. europaea TaxID=158383 RepID=A0A8S0Q8A0_OLEEU|nr:zinc finger ZAT4-like [Olea europaea subsp. europaea]